MKEKFKFGTVAIIGAPNAGKSTLVNSIVGSEVAITSNMAGTTRDVIRGVLTSKDSQIIFTDTPGMQITTNLLERKMNRSISGAVKSADVICYVVDVAGLDQDVMNKLGNYKDFGVPVIVALTKIDKVKPEKIFKCLDKLKQHDFVTALVPVSACKRIGLDILLAEIKRLLPAGEALLDKELYTDTSTRKMAEEIIRGEIINNIRDEIPHGVKVVITEFTEVERTVKIATDIICDKESHKKIIIGNSGNVIKKIGIEARRKIEKLLSRHVMLKTFVLVREGWRDKSAWVND